MAATVATVGLNPNPSTLLQNTGSDKGIVVCNGVILGQGAAGNPMKASHDAAVAAQKGLTYGLTQQVVEKAGAEKVHVDADHLALFAVNTPKQIRCRHILIKHKDVRNPFVRKQHK